MIHRMLSRSLALLASAACLSAACLSAASLPAQAAWPEKPITFVVPSAAGGSPDVLSRIVTNELSKSLGVPVVIDNRPGAPATSGSCRSGAGRRTATPSATAT